MKTKKNEIAGDLSRQKFCLRIVVKFRRLAEVPPPELDNFFSTGDIMPWNQFEKAIPGLKITRLFTSVEPVEIDNLVEKARALDHTYTPPEFLNYYVIDCADEIKADEILQTLITSEMVELTYLVYDSTPPHSPNSTERPSKILQRYLGPAPGGINAQYAWEFKGGNGEGQVRFVDIEQGWILNHESIRVNSLPCTGVSHAFHDHGAAVLGIVMMQDNKMGGRGITPRVNGYVISQWRWDGCLNNADAFMSVLPELRFGDVILLEAQVRDSSYRKNLWPVEIHEATFQVMRLAHALGITVIEPSGNGDLLFNLGKDLDTFESDAKNILNRIHPCFRDSGAIMVAAASSDLPHKRMYNSNYGSRIDCYAWGENVETAGSFPRSSEGALTSYTSQFCGTSSAAAIVAGAAIAVQSIVEANHDMRLSPVEMRRILSSEEFGTTSANGHLTDKIGVMPDLKRIIDNALPRCAESPSFRRR